MHHRCILTFTGNALAETTQLHNTWQEGKTQRATSSSFQMGGKGINVMRMLRRLGADSSALCFLGGKTGEQCLEWLLRNKAFFHAVPTQAATRQGLVVRAEGRAETTFLGPDCPPDAAAWEGMARLLLEEQKTRKGKQASCLALCGSIPGWQDEISAPFREALDAWLKARRFLAVDSYGPPLAWAVTQPVDLVKINADELRALTGAPPSRRIPTLLEKLAHNSPVKRWVVSDGPRPVFFKEGEAPPGRMLPPKIEEVSATGSGDVLLAGILHGMINGKLPLQEALRAALPLAAANAAHPGIAEFPLPVPRQG